ncbi:hypothetical protein CLHOM_24080 [Clostridium homopropionicum DSM 5847]|uniref:DUF2325 domain-containing protein n=1 Tax=Clostridium homopropionicum DSM 5847 TaxID=1121318 RepID=A0A0L6Z8K8_9CLOT|nr:DUF2325 domain-containing protein [Clostridium homopropionicum]KOA19302.1 hypothetical protein CLHOM_24080 [Clostridium homopropionicum DSM 5847]SFG20398.1 hypothetical protein SAMN04488501_106167 [Clostridium homopropionicum]
MSIVLVGGHERMQDEYKSIADKHGHRIKVFTQMPARFNKIIGAPDAIILLTSTVSHKMVLTAVKEAKRKRIHVVRCHTSSGSSLEETLKQLEVEVC